MWKSFIIIHYYSLSFIRVLRLFSKFDIDGSGEISTLELSAALRAIGYPTSLTVLQNLVQEVDVDGSGEIDEGEFFKLIRKYKNREMMECEKLYEKWAVHPEEEGMSLRFF